MAGGGVAPTTASSEKSPSAGATAINAALFSQLGVGPQQALQQVASQPQQQYYQPQQTYYQPQQTYYQPTKTAQPQQPQQAVTGQTILQNSYNPYTASPSQSLNIPGFQGITNPFYSAPKPTAAPQQNNLMEQYTAYAKKQSDTLAAAKAKNDAQAAAMAKAYADAQAAARARAEAEKAKAEAALATEFGSPAWFAQQNGWTGANGGIASLQKGFKR